MNPNNFQNMTVGMQHPQTPLQRQPQLPDALFNHYSRQQAPSGWQTNVPIQERVQNALQIITALRLIQGALRPQEMLQMATNFEMQTFVSAQSLDMYKVAINQKLHDIKDKRQSMANLPIQQPNSSMPLQRAGPQQMPMQGAVPNQPPNQSQNQFSLGVPHHLPQQMQPSPIPMHQSRMQPPPGSENAAHPPTQQEQQWQHPPQNMQQKPQSNLPPLTQDEMRQTSIMANEAMAKQTPESAEKLRANVPPMYREQLASKHIDPAYWMLQQQAVRKLQMLKYSRSQGQGSGQIPVQVSASDAAGTLQTVNSMPQRPTQPGGPLSQQAQPGGISIDPHLHMSQYLAQQADASRLQDAGQLVVPASKNSITFQHPGQPVRPGHQGIPQPGIAPNGTPQQPPQQHSLANPQQLQALQARARAAQPRPNDEAQQAALRGQAGGLNGPQLGVQQSPAMSMLNRPMTQPGQQDTIAQAMAPNPAPYMNQQPGTSVDTRTGQMMGQPAQAPTMRGALPAQQLNLPAHLSKMLATLPNLTKQRLMENPAQLPAFLESMREQQAASGTSQAIANMVQPLQGRHVTPQMLQPGQSINNQLMKTGLPDMAQGVQQNETQLATGFMPPQTPQRHFQQGSMGTMPPAIQQALNSMTPDIIQKMDETPFPPGLLNPTTAAIPANVRTWGDLKRWTQANAANMPPNAAESIRRQQALEYRRLFFEQHPHQQHQNMASAQFPNGTSGAWPQPMGQPTGPAPQPRMTMPGIQRQQMIPQQQQLQPPQVRPPQGQQGIPAMQAPSIQEIQQIRQANQGAVNMTDDHIRQLLMNQKLLQLKKQQDSLHSGQREPTQQHQRPPDQVQQPTYNTQEDMFLQQQQLQQRQLQQPEYGQATMSIQHIGRSGHPAGMTGKRAAPGENRVDGPIGQQTQSNLKRPVPGNDDVIEVPNPNLASSRNMQTPAVQPTRPRQGHAGPTPEQLAAMTSQRREQFQARAQALQQGRKQGQIDSQAGQAASTKQDPGAQGSPPKQISTQDPQRLAQFNELLAEIGSKTPRKPPLPLKMEEKQEINKQLALMKGQLKSVDHAIRIYYLGNEGPKTEDITRQVLLMRFLVNQQEKASSTESYSTTPSDLNQCLKNMFQFRQMAFKQYQEKLARPQQQQQRMTPQQELAHLQAHQASTESVDKRQPQPSPANLESQQHPAHHAPKIAVNKLSDSKPPAAPTTAHPPFSLGVSSPQGVPQYGPTELTADKLKLPPNKKQRIGASPASTPLAHQATPGSLASPMVGRQASPETKKQPVHSKTMEPAKPAYKCPDENCEASIKGFFREEDLEKHTKEAHPHIDDPLQYCLDAMATALGLNSDGTVKKKEMPKSAAAPAAQKDNKPIVTAAATKPMATAMQKSASKAGAPLGSKQEVATQQPGPPSTPMSRVATVNSALKATPAAKDSLKTPQHPAQIKGGTPVSPSPAKQFVPDSMKPSTSAPPSKAEVKPNPTPPSSEEVNKQAWANSTISPEYIRQSFAGLIDLGGADIFDTFGDIRDDDEEDLSPTDSTKSSEESRKSNISVNDELDLKVQVGGVDVDVARWFDPVMDVEDPVAMELQGLEIGSPQDGDANKTKEKDKSEAKKKFPDPVSLKWDDVFGPNAGLEDHSIPGWPERDVLSVFDDMVREGGLDALDDVMF